MMYQHWIAWQEGKELYIMPKWIKYLKTWIELKAETPFKVIIETALGLFCLATLLVVLTVIILAF